MHMSSQTFCTFFTVFYTTVCDYGIAHSFIEGSLIVVSRLDHPAVVIVLRYEGGNMKVMLKTDCGFSKNIGVKVCDSRSMHVWSLVML